MSYVARSLVAAVVVTAAFAVSDAGAEESQLGVINYTANQTISGFAALGGTIDVRTRPPVTVALIRVPSSPPPASPVPVYVAWNGTAWLTTTTPQKLPTTVSGATWTPAFTLPTGVNLPNGKYTVTVEVTSTLPPYAKVSASVTVTVQAEGTRPQQP